MGVVGLGYGGCGTDKQPSTRRDPSTIVNRTVTPRRPRNADLREREYLTPKEVDRLQDADRKHSRYGHGDATAIRPKP